MNTYKIKPFDEANQKLTVEFGIDGQTKTLVMDARYIPVEDEKALAEYLNEMALGMKNEVVKKLDTKVALNVIVTAVAKADIVVEPIEVEPIEEIIK